MEKYKVIYIPGNGGGGVDVLSPIHENWIPWVKKELERVGETKRKSDKETKINRDKETKIEVIAVDFPDPELARSKFWLPHIEKLEADENTILIGWSSGAVAAMRYAETHKILATILVAACYTDLGIETEKQSGYFNRPWDWETIKKNQKWIVQFASTNDPFIPIEEARHVQKHLNTEYYEMKNMEHFGYPVPKYEFPEIVEVIKRKLNENYF